LTGGLSIMTTAISPVMEKLTASLTLALLGSGSTTRCWFSNAPPK
jgi:hypothetical protein